MDLADILCRPPGLTESIDSAEPPESTQSQESPGLDLPTSKFTPYRWSDEYPRASALPRELTPHKASEADQHFLRLQNEDDRLFHKSKHEIVIFESDSRNGDGRQQYTCTSTEELVQRYLRVKPLIRHVFIEADSSRSPLNCSASMLKWILAYEEVPPDFLKAVYAFGEQEEEPTDAGLAGFGYDEGRLRRYHNWETASLDEHRYDSCQWYLIRTVEKSDFDYGSPSRSPWTIRQTAVYHSFNSLTGRSFFLTIRGNNEFRKQMWEHKSLLVDPSAGKEKEEVFPIVRQTAFATQLLYLSWFCRGWDEFIRHSRDEVRDLLRLNHIVVNTKPEDVRSELEHGPKSVERADPRLGEILEKFSLGGLQRANAYSRRIRNALLALEETSNILRRIKNQYISYMDGQIDVDIVMDATGVVTGFLRELDVFSETTKAAQSNLKALSEEIRDGTQLYKEWWHLRLWLFVQQKREHERSLGTATGPPAGADSSGSRKRPDSSDLDVSSTAPGAEAE